MKKILFLIIILFTLYGCEDFLDVDIKGKSTEENFYSTINEMQLSLNAVYAVLKSEDFQNTLALIGDALSDDFIYQAGSYTNFGSDGLKLQNFNISADNIWVKKWYTINYRGISKANQFLRHINDNIRLSYNKNDDTDLRRWQHMYGQALFLRAYYYFNLVRTFGGVSIVPETVDVENPAIARSTVEETYFYIEKDLRTACILLSEYIPSEDYGEISQYAGLSMLMKVLVTRATPGVSSEMWEEARDIGKTIVANQSDPSAELTYNDILKLETFYPDMTWEEWKATFRLDSRIDESELDEMVQENGSGIFQDYNTMSSKHGFTMKWEQMLRVDFQNLTANKEPIFFVLSMDATGVDPEEINLLNRMDDLYNTVFCPSISLMNLMANYEGIDPRNLYGCYSHNMQPIGYNPPEYNEIWGGVFYENFQRFVKFFLIPDTEVPFGGDGLSPRNITLLRYSDVLLLYAEALNESGDRTTPIDIINDLRANLKASIPKIDNIFKYTIAYGPYEYVRDRIRIERRKELTGERVRYFDLLRYGNVGDVITKAYKNETAPSKQYISFVKGVNELLPIPQVEIELSHGIIDQNPGY